MEKTHIVICLSIATDSCIHSPTNLNPPVKSVLKNKTSYHWAVPTFFSFPKVINASMDHDLLILNSVVMASRQAPSPIPAVRS